jgi:acyl carrier protein
MAELDVFNEVVAAIRQETENDDIDIDDETTAGQIPGWDSLAHVRIVLNIEVRLDTPIDISDTYSAANVGELVELVRFRIKAKGGG